MQKGYNTLQKILDVTRFESQSLLLNKERFNIMEIVQTAVADCTKAITGGKLKVELLYSPEAIFVGCRKLKEIDSKVKVCFITAFETYYEKFKQEFFPLEEIKGFIRKPIQTEDLIQFTNQVTR
jgi:hypothetical protein